MSNLDFGVRLKLLLVEVPQYGAPDCLLEITLLNL
jgi:hypothetical protein